jgi:hypothetical protein
LPSPTFQPAGGRAGRTYRESRSLGRGLAGDRIITPNGLQRHVTGTLDGTLVHFEQDRADEPDDRILFREDAEHLGAAIALAVGLARCCREGHVVVGEARELRQFGQLIGDTAPLASASFGVILLERGRGEGRRHVGRCGRHWPGRYA